MALGGVDRLWRKKVQGGEGGLRFHTEVHLWWVTLALTKSDGELVLSAHYHLQLYEQLTGLSKVSFVMICVVISWREQLPLLRVLYEAAKVAVLGLV